LFFPLQKPSAAITENPLGFSNNGVWGFAPTSIVFEFLALPKIKNGTCVYTHVMLAIPPPPLRGHNLFVKMRQKEP
jgi:hypothetical protein